MSRTALSASEKPAEANAKQATNQRSKAKYDSTKKAFLRQLPPHIQTAYVNAQEVWYTLPGVWYTFGGFEGGGMRGFKRVSRRLQGG